MLLFNTIHVSSFFKYDGVYFIDEKIKRNLRNKEN